MDRRDFLKTTAVASIGIGAGVLLPLRSAWAFTQSPALRKFETPLRRFGSDIPFAVSDGKGYAGATHYTITMREFTDVLHPDLGPDGTRLWGYTTGADPANWRHLGASIVAKRGEKVQITFRNELPARHLLPVDTTITGANLGPNRATVHLHGGKVPWVSDGGPHSWWAPASQSDPMLQRGSSFVDLAPVLGMPASPNGSAEYFYPNDQSARIMWFHDHALGTTRLNAYAGLAAAYILTDDYETRLTAQNNLPGPLDPRTVYLVFQDKSFVPSNINALDPGWATVRPDSRPGDLWYPHVYEPTRWAVGAATQPLPTPSVIPEMFGDTMLVNGTAYPYLTVEQRQYRFRMLNACNARFLNPRLVYAHTGAATEPNANAVGPSFIQIGNEGGFLPAPTLINSRGGVPLLLAPAERADLIVDFTAVPAGSTLILYNDAPAPFPRGDARYDYYPQNPKTPSSLPGFGPNTRSLLQIRVVAKSDPADPPITLPSTFDRSQLDPFIVTQTPGVPTENPPGMTVRHLTLNEAFDQYGRLVQFLGTNQPVAITRKTASFGRTYDDPPTEIISAGTTEIWEIANLTGDTHPIHFHLANAQVLNRQRFSSTTYPRGQSTPFNGFTSANYLGKPIAPDANELGWKETVRVNPGEVTRIAIRFDLPAVTFSVPPSPRTGDNEYVWHCHILEHEEHDMMRPLIVK